MAPPDMLAATLLLEMVLSLMFRVPLLRSMAPPLVRGVGSKLSMVRLFRVTLVALMSNPWTVPPPPLRVISATLSPPEISPSMVRLLVMVSLLPRVRVEPARPASKVMVSPAAAIPIASRRESPRPSGTPTVSRPPKASSTDVVTVMVARTPEKSRCAAASTATALSTAPRVTSRYQSPPRCAAPVGSSEAATSAPVSWESRETNAAPSVPAPTSQP